GTSAAAPPAPVETPEVTYRQLDAAATVETASGASIPVPSGWFVAEAPDVVRLQTPEQDLSIAMLAVEAKDRDAAVAAAWAAVDPSFDLAVAQADDLPPDGGWDASSQVVYVTSTDEARVVLALARRTGAVWYVALVDGTAAALNRRGAQLGSIVRDMKVPGVEAESLAGRAAQLDADRLATWGEFVEQARVATDVPGVAVAVVHGGKIVFERGFGDKLRGGTKKNAVAPTTLFAIGSITKSFTTLLIARLVDRGVVRWDEPVVEALPQFALADAELTREVTMQHTGCACTGLPRQDFELIFEFGGWTAEQRVASMAAMAPTTGFGETFQYSNLMVAVGGWAAGHAYAPKKKLGAAYAEALQKLVLTPLGMKTATLDRVKAGKGDAARPHGEGIAPGYQPIPLAWEAFAEAVAPAGALWASVRDMSKIMLFELARGKTPDGKQLVSEANLLLRRTPQVKISAHDAYGLGLVVHDERGIAEVTHDGGTFGFTSNMFILPDQDIGVIVLTNAGGAGLLQSVVHQRFYELVFGAEERAATQLTEGVARAKAHAEAEVAMEQVPDDAWIAPLLGAYTEPGLGRIELRRDGARIVLDAGEWQTEVAKKTDRDGTVKLITTGPSVAGLELVPRQQDGKQVLVLDVGQQVYTFVPAK
ncbi:MAG: beta-lactamase family protein, partial [Myxococcales bacterium]|nr:beta-lactamase family protein [Myxococcales bacterium]